MFLFISILLILIFRDALGSSSSKLFTKNEIKSITPKSIPIMIIKVIIPQPLLFNFIFHHQNNFITFLIVFQVFENKRNSTL